MDEEIIKNEYDLLTAEDISRETGINICAIRKLFQDDEFPVQTWTKPFVIMRKAFYEYLEKRH